MPGSVLELAVPMVSMDTSTTLDPRLALSAEFTEAVRRHVDGVATGEDMKLLRANEKLWIRALYRLLDDIAELIDDVRVAVRWRQRAQVIADLESDYRAVDAALTDLAGPPQESLRTRRRTGVSSPPGATSRFGVSQSPDAASGIVELQLSWIPGRVIAWAAGPGCGAEGAGEVLRRLRDTGAVTVEWEEHRMVKLDDGTRAEAVSAGIDSCLGWLVALGESAESDGIGASVSWLGLVTALAVRLTAQGRIVPQLKKLRRWPGSSDDEAARSGKNSPSKNAGAMAGFGVRWVPALVGAE